MNSRTALAALIAGLAPAAAAQTFVPPNAEPSAVADQRERADVKTDAARISEKLKTFVHQGRYVRSPVGKTIFEVNEIVEASGGVRERGRLEIALRTTILQPGAAWNHGNLIVEKTAEIVVGADGGVLKASYRVRDIDGDYYPDFRNYTVDDIRYKIPPGSKDFEASWREAKRLLLAD